MPSPEGPDWVLLITVKIANLQSHVFLDYLIGVKKLKRGARV
jgi:hypothetical protein